MANFYIVATPIGNLEDISPRALRILGEVDLILCEDTRVTRKLLHHYKIKTPTESYHSQSTLSKTERILDLLSKGNDLALVSDSGTPTISDPGSYLISLVRSEFGDGVNIISIPGPSAVVSALSISGLPASEFLFLGFLPHKKGRETLFKEIAESKRTSVFYESPHRLLKALTSLSEHLNDDRIVVITKEISKIYEEALEGTPKEVLDYFTEHKDTIKGEFVIMVSGV